VKPTGFDPKVLPIRTVLRFLQIARQGRPAGEPEDHVGHPAGPEGDTAGHSKGENKKQALMRRSAI